jgi:hypothetical protein
MLGNVIGLNNARFQESLSLINSYASSDKVMKGTGNSLVCCSISSSKCLQHNKSSWTNTNTFLM